jgi:GNAT superfamily N-acetyltransferase
MQTIIRAATPEDEGRWRELWADYTSFYDVHVSDEVTASVWSRIFDPSSTLFLRVAEVEGIVQGFALCLTHEGTWVKEPICYLEDLFLDASLRGAGIGRALMDDLVSLCEKNGWCRLYWHTHEDNATARKLYDRYVLSDGHIRYRISL